MMNQTLYESEIIDFFVSHTESVNFYCLLSSEWRSTDSGNYTN